MAQYNRNAFIVSTLRKKSTTSNYLPSLTCTWPGSAGGGMHWIGLQTTKYVHKETTCVISWATFIHVYCSSAWFCTTHPQTPCLGTHEPCRWPAFYARGWSGCVHSKEMNLQESSTLGSGSWVRGVKTSWICMRAIWRVFYLFFWLFL